MIERPILFNAAMVLAILDGSKTQTRRILSADWLRCLDPEDADDVPRILGQCPYGQPGDRLWVRETWAPRQPGPYVYRATWPDAVKRWRPSIHMPRHVSRISLEVTAVRVERLQSISEDDARAEGVCMVDCTERPVHHHREGFAALWNLINLERAPWSADPLVWVVSFKVHSLGNERDRMIRGAASVSVTAARGVLTYDDEEHELIVALAAGSAP